MPANRYFIVADFIKGEEVSIVGDEFHYLQKVMRKKEGDTVELVNGKGNLAIGIISHIERKQAEAAIQDLQSKPLPLPLIVAIPYARQNKLDWIVEKGCELGATAFWLYPAERGEKSTLSETQLKRIEALLIASIKQCGRLDLPQVKQLPPIAGWQKFDKTLLFGDTREKAPPLFAHQPEKGVGIVFVTGPEGGLSPQEIIHLERLRAYGVRLHPHILRMETAPLCALSLLSSYQLGSSR